MRVHVHGAGGRMGVTVVAAVEAASDLMLVGRSGRHDDLAAALEVSQPDVLVEFTLPAVAERHVLVALQRGVHVVSGTTGLDAAALARIDAAARAAHRGAIVAPNFALGVLLLQRFAVSAARWFDDVEIVEMHHERKVDAPSGTALDTARRIAAAATRPLNRGPGRISTGDDDRSRGRREADVPVHAVRLPGLVAHQEVLFGATGQLLTIRHDALDRSAYMPGVLLAIRRVGAQLGLLDSLHPLLDEVP